MELESTSFVEPKRKIYLLQTKRSVTVVRLVPCGGYTDGEQKFQSFS